MPFTDAPWSSPESDLDVNAYCSVCLIDENTPGQEKIKGKCKLPVRNTPGGPYNKNALRAASAALAGARGGVQADAQSKKKAARKLVRLFAEAMMEPGESLINMARG